MELQPHDAPSSILRGSPAGRKSSTASSFLKESITTFRGDANDPYLDFLEIEDTVMHFAFMRYASMSDQ